MDEQEQTVPLEDNLITLATFRDLSEALLAKGKLDAADIHCVLADDNILRMDWFLANLIGGVKLNVPESQAETAYKLLFGEQEPVPGEDQPLKCPKCGSEEIGIVDPGKGVRLASLWAIGLPLPRLTSTHWECVRCGAKWVDDEE